MTIDEQISQTYKSEETIRATIKIGQERDARLEFLRKKRDMLLRKKGATE